MHVLSWHQVDLAGVVLTWLIAGYVMAIAGLWAGAVPGLVAFDIADFGRRYMVSDRSSAWLLGFASHLVNSILLVLVWAMLIVPNFPWPRPLVGIAWGVFLALALAGGLIVPLSCSLDGQILAEELHGLFAGDTRVLSTYKVLVSGQDWRLLGRSHFGHGTAQWEYQNRPLRDAAGEIPAGTLLLTLRRRVDCALHDIQKSLTK
jgi:N-terminal domain of (some) glycogen debranching enzymes